MKNIMPFLVAFACVCANADGLENKPNADELANKDFTAQSFAPTPPTQIQSPLESTSQNTTQEASPNPKSTSKYFSTNPAFNEYQNALRVDIGASVREIGFENMYNAQIMYSQPNRIFRAHGRLNLEFGGFFGFGKSTPNPTNNGTNKSNGLDLASFNLAFLGISEEVLLPFFISQKYGNVYAGVGLGAYIKDKGEARVGSNFTFGERAFVGYLWHKFILEIFIKHFSNGTLSRPNAGHNFFGLSFGYVF